mmetsp:Transcript_46321/g.132566  ORF Transcript_46321/g.132566 Transcript_46321/m.132566 type:complete len:102 (-) Transcript_46321:124-429(-)
MMDVLNAICRLLSCAFDEKHILKWPFARVLERPLDLVSVRGQRGFSQFLLLVCDCVAFLFRRFTGIASQTCWLFHRSRQRCLSAVFVGVAHIEWFAFIAIL